MLQARQTLPRALGDGQYDDLVDPRLDGDFDKTEAARLVACAAAAVRHAARRRPKMSQVPPPQFDLDRALFPIARTRRELNRAGCCRS
jgi:hypothetical protein